MMFVTASELKLLPDRQANSLKEKLLVSFMVINLSQIVEEPKV